MTFLLNGSEGLDRIKCMEMALVHDLAESLVGDITPYCGVSKKDKEVLEMEAIHKICGLIEPRGDHILQLFYVSIFTAREREGEGKKVSSCSRSTWLRLLMCQKYKTTHNHSSPLVRNPRRNVNGKLFLFLGFTRSSVVLFLGCRDTERRY